MTQRFLDLQDSGELVLEKGESIVSSKKDGLLIYFGREYSKLLSHKKIVDGISAEQINNAFFHKRNSPDEYMNSESNTTNFVERTLSNMVTRHAYSKTMALDTVIFALEKGIVNLEKIIV